MAPVPSGWLRMRFSCLLGLLNVSGTGFNGVLENGWLQVSVPACVRVFSRVCLECVCSYSVLHCWQEESEEEAVFVIFPCCHGHGAFWCCHHQRNYMQRLTTVILLTAYVSLKSPNKRITVSPLLPLYWQAAGEVHPERFVTIWWVFEEIWGNAKRISATD